VKGQRIESEMEDEEEPEIFTIGRDANFLGPLSAKGSL